MMEQLPKLSEIHKELQYYTRYFSENKLYQSSKWTGELLLGLTQEEDLQSSQFAMQFIQNNTDYTYQFLREFVPENNDIISVARNLFDLREFKKCASLVQNLIHKNESAMFLYYYSQYMYGELRKEEEMFENENSKTATNPELKLLDRELSKLYDQKQLSQLNLYLYGLILKDTLRLREAKEIFVQVLNQLPCFWSAWLELCRLMVEEDSINELPNHWMKFFWISNFNLEKFKNANCVESLQLLLYYFRNSNFIINQIANAYYNNQEFELSLEWFERLLSIDPYRYESLDTYSNILYIKENQGELANLALQSFTNNKYVPETCCVVGNYYSLMNEHAKAINYFQRALKLDKDCLAAWTLMGHEYLEMKNVASAIQSYRNAVEIDPKDFRAWYGLGQTYALQGMNQYALYYFSRAVVSRPKDARMWNAMAECYDKMDKKNESMKCYERANSCKDKEGIAIHQLAKLYDAVGKEEKALFAFEESLKRKDEEQAVDKEVSEALLYLARAFLKKGDKERAMQMAKRLFDFNGPERDEANLIMNQLNK
ncbi:unnamed protein product [Paramecium sonneborni]|uniref:Cdc23 domain-containing protein n=1 Tax=Paramecium sonneborni TaxID=65129 RepID=A0A8S1PY67_9CILI|nr:unnamed protein product [Paramecium sonneborni]